MELKPTICFDYRNEQNKLLYFKLTINKESLIKIAKNIWSKIKRPKRTHPKKTF